MNSNIQQEMNPDRDEYELELYNFTVDQFMQENCLGIKLKTKLMVDNAVKRLINKLAIEKSDVIENLKVARGKVIAGIHKKIEPKILEMNKNSIEKNFRIPDNVVLNNPRKLLSEEEQKQLEHEVNEMSSAVEQNAFFITSLNDELFSYEKIEDNILADKVMIEKIEAEQDNLLDLVVLENTVNKLNKS